jgi:hypothetical protein
MPNLSRYAPEADGERRRQGRKAGRRQGDLAMETAADMGAGGRKVFDG